MGKDKFDELEEELEEEEQEEVAETPAAETKESEVGKVEIDFNLDPVERIKLEMECSKQPNEKEFGEYLLKQFEHDEPLKNAYKERKITLKAINDFVYECAKKHLNGNSGRIADDVVFGWVLHYVQDEQVEIKTAEKLVLTKEDKELAYKKALEQYQAEELAKIKKAEQKKIEAEKKKNEKAKTKEQELGMMNLFEDFE